jgi:glycerate kinase
MNSQQLCWACSQTTYRKRTHSSGVGHVVKQHIGNELTAVVLGLWSDNTWGMKSHQWCWACSQLDRIRARIYSIGFGLVVRQHRKRTHSSGVGHVVSKHIDHELTSGVVLMV